MQRSAASSSQPVPKTHATPGSPVSKRQRLHSGAPSPRYSTSELESIQAALAEEELKRSLAVEKRAADLGETRWVLSVREQSSPKEEDLIIEPLSFAEIDSDSDLEDDDVEQQTKGRRTFGKVSLRLELTVSADLQKYQSHITNRSQETESSSNTSNDSDNDQEYDPLSVNALIKEGKAAVSVESNIQSHANGKLELRQISSGGGQSLSNKTCHRCGKRGHLKRDCPN